MYKKLVRLDDSLKALLQEEADKLDRSVNWLINDALTKRLTQKKKPKTKEIELKREPIVLPDYIDAELWLAFMEVRKKLKAPETENAHKLILSKLDNMWSNGQDPNKAIEASIENGWKGVFPPKGGSSNTQRNVPLGDW